MDHGCSRVYLSMQSIFVHLWVHTSPGGCPRRQGKQNLIWDPFQMSRNVITELTVFIRHTVSCRNDQSTITFQQLSPLSIYWDPVSCQCIWTVKFDNAGGPVCMCSVTSLVKHIQLVLTVHADKWWRRPNESFVARRVLSARTCFTGPTLSIFSFDCKLSSSIWQSINDKLIKYSKLKLIIIRKALVCLTRVW